MRHSTLCYRADGSNRNAGGLRPLSAGVKVLALTLAVGLGACGADDEGGVTASNRLDRDASAVVEETLIEKGRVAYTVYCAGCHGVDGDGKGEAARFLSPRPRNFQLANFKFSSTRSGRLPTDDDLEKTIKNGLKGSAMPEWDLLPAREIDGLIAYIKTFSPKWKERRPVSRIPMVDDPYRALEDKSEAIRRGEVVYHGFATCWTCHPAYVSHDLINEHLVAMENPSRDTFRPDLYESEVKPNSEGELIYPPDFRRDFVRAGADVWDLHRSIAAGISGTAMPTWVDSMEYPSRRDPTRPLVTPADIWALAYYVQSLIMERPAKLTEGDFEVRDRRQKIYLQGEPPVPVVEPAEAVEEGEFFEEEEFEEEDFEDQ